MPAQLTRRPISNHLNSVSVELDGTGQVISHEENNTFGSTSYQGLQNRQPPAKKYRFSGKERDRQTGFNCHGSRYYLPWLGRWASADPGSLVDGLNVVSYVNNSPINLIDPSGTGGAFTEEILFRSVF
jgi:RHS repeat-associated protein